MSAGQSLLIENIGVLCTMQPGMPDARGMLGAVEDASLLIDQGRVVFAGSQRKAPTVAAKVARLDAEGCAVLPGLVDCHTHLVFAGSRVGDYVLRSQGKSYKDILEAGGGIYSTVQATRKASDEELYELGRERLDAMLRRGVTTIEAKSGYGLRLNDEQRILEIYKRLSDAHAIDIEPTFLGAHVVAPEAANEESYVREIVDDMIPRIASLKLAKHCDVFVEPQAFSLSSARRIGLKAFAHGLAVRFHGEQLSHTGATRLAAEIGALSVSHLEYATDSDIAAMAEKNVVAEMLPIAELYLGNKTHVSARRFIDAGVRVALATDFNPGSAMCGDIWLAARLGVATAGLTAEEAMLGITKHAAAALGRSDIGHLGVGALGDAIVLSGANPFDALYDWSKNPVRHVVKYGLYSESGRPGVKPENM